MPTDSAFGSTGPVPAPQPPAPVVPQPPAPAAPPALRRFGDHDATRELLFNNALDAVKGVGPVENSRYRLEAADVGYGKRTPFTTAEQKAAMLEGRTLAHRITGTIRLVDKGTGTVVDARRMTLAAVPYLTKSGTFILDGNQSVVSHQSRLDPGVFTRRKSNGSTEAHVNFTPGGGVPHRIRLDPETGAFKVVVGQAELPAATLLRVLGATENDLRDAWGPDLARVNLKADKPHHLDGYYDKFGPSGPVPESAEGKSAALVARLSGFRFDPWVNQRTLGAPHTGYNKDVVLATTKKLLDVAHGRAEPDDRDHPAFSSVWGPEHLIPERLARSRPVWSKVLWQATNSGSLKSVPPGFLTPAVRGFFTKSGLAQNPEGSSAAEFMDHGSRITKVGEGGIGRSADAVPDSARWVSSGQVPFIDLVRTSESGSVGVDLRTAFGTKIGTDRRIYAPMALPNGRIVYRSPRDLADAVVAFPGARSNTDPLIPVIKNGKAGYARREEVQYHIPSMEQTFSPMTNMVPLKSASKPHRSSMGARMSVTGDTEVIVSRADGSVYYGPISGYGWSSGDRAVSVDKVTKEVVWKLVRAKIEHANTKRILRVTLKSGRHVDATFDHSFVTIDAIGDLVKVHAADLARRLPVPTTGCAPLPSGSKLTWDVAAGHIHNAYPAVVMPLDFETGWMHGRYLADGHLIVRDAASKYAGDVASVTFAHSAPEMNARLVAFFARLGVAAREQYDAQDGAVDRVVVNWRQLGEALRADFGSGSCNKLVPPWALAAPDEYRRGLIAGHLSGDGCVVPRRNTFRMSLSSRSIKLRNGLCEVLSTIGIATTLVNEMTKTGPGGTDAPHYTAEVCAEHIHLLPALGNAKKDAKLKKAKWSGKRSTDHFPNFKDLRSAVVRATVRGSVERGRIGASKMVRATAVKVLGLEGDTNAHRWLRSAVRWDLVDSVTELDAALYPVVYDLDLEDNVFAVNGGVFVHNTTQSLPLRNPEAPLVRSGVPGQPGKSFEELFGKHMGVVTAPADKGGTVESVDKDRMVVRHDDGTRETHDLYDYVPTGRKTGLVSVPLVKAGDRYAPGQVLARSNYTDANGHAAYGTTARVAFMTGRGSVYEDSFAVSKSFADQMTSHHVYRHQVDADADTAVGRQVHTAAFPGRHPLDTLKTIGDDGVVKPGTVVKSGDPLVLAVRRRQGEYGRLSRSAKAAVTDASEVWDHDEPGTVVGAHHTPNGPVVLVETFKKLKEGDKVAGRHGNKGVVNIVDDHEMPVAADGKPVDVIMSSLGTISRTNPSAIFEAALGKVAARTGRPYVVHDFEDGQNVGKYVEDELAKHGTKFTEDVTDPQTGRAIKNVGVGNLYLMKLSHMAESKAKGRGLGGYDESGQPTRGQEGGAMRSSLGDTMALLSYGACFQRSVLITTDNGPMPIGDIVDGKLAVRVACADPLGNVVYRPVTNWFARQAQPDELVTVLVPRVVDHNFGVFNQIRCTGNHEFFTRRGKVAARDLTLSDVLLRPSTYLASWQQNLIVGTLMGDGSFQVRYAADGHATHCGGLRVTHGVKQRTYLDWKAIRLDAIHGAVHEGESVRNGVASRFAVATFNKTPFTHRLAGEFYNSGRKVVPHGVVARMGWYGLGVWFADDGGCSKRPGTDYVVEYRIATNAFTVEEVDRLAVELTEFSGLSWRRVMQKEGKDRVPILALNQGGRGGGQLARWAAAIAPYLPPMMGYKIAYTYPVGAAWVDKIGEHRRVLEEVPVLGIRCDGKWGPKLRPRIPVTVYDITVDEHHNYFAEGVLVSNSKVLKDAHLNKGQSNSAFWIGYMAGFPVAHATTSQPFQRFLTELRAAGVNPVRRGDRYQFLGLKQADVDALARDRVVKNGETLDFSRDNKPYPGGLHDPHIFGAVDSQTQWAKVPLHEPVINPVFEEPARRLLGLTESKFRDTIAGRHTLPNGLTGSAGLVAALKAYDVKGELAKARTDFESTRKTVREAAVRKLGYLKHLDASGGSPADWVWSSVPVLPPAYRPVSPGRGGSNAVVHDANFLYRELIEANDAHRTLAGKVADTGAERLNVYDAVRAVAGLGDPVTAKNQERGVKGVLAKLLGDTSKMSYVQQHLLGTPVDLSGRGQVLPSPDMGLDEIGVPESVAWQMYHPFVVRRLVRAGYPRVQAALHARDRTDAAKRALVEEMQGRPVLATRYPVLHRYGVMGFKPKLVAGDSILTNNLVNKPFGLDHDGDQQFNSVVVYLNKEDVGLNIHGVPPEFWELRDMTARFRASVPTFNINDGKYFCVHLSDFPHGEKLGEKMGANGRIEFFAVDPRIQVVAYDEELGAPTLAPVAGWSVHHDREVETVTLLSGRQIVSDDDERAVYGLDPRTMSFVRARPKDAIGLMVPRVDRFFWDAGCTTTVYRNRHGDPYAFDLTESSGYVFGALAGNGWVSGPDGEYRQIHLACTDPGVKAAFKAAFSDEFPGTHFSNTTVRAAADATGYGASERLTVGNAELTRHVAELIGHGARHKHLPPFFLSGGVGFRRGLLRGLMDTDGSIAISTGKTKPQLLVNFSSSSLRLVQEVQHLARSLGVVSTITATRTPAGEPFWLLNVSAPDFQALNLAISHTDKARKLASAPAASVGSSGYARNNMVPFPGDLVPAVRKFVTLKVDRGAYYALTTAVETNRIARAHADRVIALAPEGFGAGDPLWERFCRAAADRSTVWDAVTGYEKTGIRETGYDLTVPEFETFMSTDGVILSNTMTLNVPLADDAVKEVYDKLLPSKNLFSPATMKASLWLPNMEYQQGLHALTSGDARNPPIEFATLADAKRALQRGEIDHSTRVRILDRD